MSRAALHASVDLDREGAYRLIDAMQAELEGTVLLGGAADRSSTRNDVVRVYISGAGPMPPES